MQSGCVSQGIFPAKMVFLIVGKLMVGSMVVVSVWLCMYLVVHVCGSVQYSIIGREGEEEHMWEGELTTHNNRIITCGT